jgi:cell division protein FtsW
MIRMDMGLFIALLLMIGSGVVLVYSSSFALASERFGGSEFFFARQMVRALIALAGFMVFINVDYHVWGRVSNMAYLFAVLLLIAVLLLPDADAVNGAKRWISVGPMKLQVSDFARMALILFVARHCHEANGEIKNYKVYFRLAGMIGVVCLLVLMEPGFSTSAILGIIGLTMLFLSGARAMHVTALGLCAVPAAAAVGMMMPHSKLRLQHFLHRGDSVSSMGYQAYQSLIGLGNGGLFGVGIGKGEQKFFYLPEPHTDFVISILGEEIGFFGLMMVVAAFVFIVYRGMKIAQHAPDKMGQLMAFGFTFVIAVYALFHAGVAVDLLPTTGIPLPFISYGGMSLIFMVCSMGIVLNVSSQTQYGMVAGKKETRTRMSKIKSRKRR